jgi:transcriptional regulator with XRE-family HTH domain
MSNEVRDTIAAEIRAEMARKQKTQYDLADVLGIPQSAVSLRLNGKRPFRAEELPIVAGLLGVPVERFYSDASNTPASTGSAAA